MTPISNAEKRRRLDALDTETLMRWAYVPFVVAEGAWDYADSVINLAAEMKLSQVKSASRKIRELKRSYDTLRRNAGIGGVGNEMNNFYIMERNSKDSFRYMYACIKDSVNKQYPGLDENHQQLLMGVYACVTVLEVLYKYMAIQEKIVCEKCGFASVSSLIPKEVGELRRIILLFAGDRPVKVKGRGLFVHNIVRCLCRSGMTKNKGDMPAE